MANRDFDVWLSKFRPSISSYDYYIDFEKVVRNVEEIKVELNILNSLIGSKNIEEDFEKIVTKYPETLQCVPLLLAVRGYEIYAQDEEGAFLYNFKKMNYSVEQYKVFMCKTGLFDMIANHLVNNLVDYALGIETGLDSNGRKNRGGHQMEDLVEKYIVATGFKKDVNYFKEMYLKDIEEKWNIDLSALSNQGKAAKRFDFVIKTDKMIYGIETNFYDDIFSEDFNVENAVKLVKLYYEIERVFEEEFEEIKSYEQKFFYILFIVHKYDKKIFEAIEILENLISEECKEITESRMLLKTKFKDKLVSQLERKEEFSFWDLFTGIGGIEV